MNIPSARLVAKYSGPGPRYTSYPTVPYWSPDYGEPQYRAALTRAASERGAGGTPNAAETSLYFHIPFCERRCTFCACNVVISRDHSRGLPYVDLLTREMDLALAAGAGDARPRIAQMHWGGGTPTWLSPDELALLHDRIAARFDLLPDREQSIEVDPRVTSVEQLDVLRGRGLSRVSMGVQDFTPRVQRALHRIQTADQTGALIDHARAIGIAGVNADLIYGLPHQTVETFAATIDRIVELGVDRIALYNFAYLPDRLAHHRAILPDWLPGVQDRLSLFLMSVERLGAAGYRMIGLDHFARESDELTRSLDDGSIQRNFMGYTTRAGRDLLSFGVSSISRIGRDFAQNAKETGEYGTRVRRGLLPVERGLRLSDDDLLREAVIQGIMCFGRVDFGALERGHGADPLGADDALRSRLDELAADGLIEQSGRCIAVTALGRFFLRNIAMCFDAYLGRPGQTVGQPVRVQFSGTV